MCSTEAVHPRRRRTTTHPYARAVASALGLLTVLLGASGCDDTPRGSAGPCGSPTITGTDDDDRLEGTPGPDVIDGGDGNDRIRGLGGDDVLCGGAGADVLDGGDGDDRLFGQADERLTADTDYHEWYGDIVRGGPGDDLLDVGADDEGGEKRVGFDTVDFRGATAGVRVVLEAGTAVGDGEDRIVGDPHGVIGTAAADVIVGTDRADSLSGWGGADRIVGGGGDDELRAHGARMTT
jgi:Ca2+-binding RTX toxin-like protein